MLGVTAAEGLARNKATPYIIGGVVLLGMGLTYFGIVRPILCATGVADCKKGKKMRGIMNYKGFDPNYSRPSKITISHDRAKKLAEQIYDSGGVFNDDEGGFYSALEEAGNADNLSLIARMFTAKYKKSLAEYITYYMDDAGEMERITDIINSY